MKVRIHRGAHEIGGSCVEVESTDGDRLVLDVGAPLVTIEGEEPVIPAVEGLIEEDPALKGVVISHAHQDHWGLVDKTLPTVPLYMGEATNRILKEAAFWVSGLTRTPAGSTRCRRYPSWPVGGLLEVPETVCSRTENTSHQPTVSRRQPAARRLASMASKHQD